MSLRGRFRKLFRARPRRRNVSPRVVELLEQRVLLTDIVYYDVLKGQNFSQTGTGNPVLQGGSPFKLHSSVHAQPTGDLQAATLGVPNSTIKTLVTQGSSQHRAFDQSFTTKSALDTAFAAGNYTFTISHLMDINFSPGLDASAGANQPPNTHVFGGQVFQPNTAGAFQETWSPSTPAINVVNGTINATAVTANLVGVNNAAATGTINATWNGSQYAGTYSFNGQNGNVTIPEGYKPTLNLPADAYPNAPHITNFTAAQAVNPAGDFTLTWDAFAGGTADDLITLFIFDGNNQVFHTDAIPLPSDSAHLDGTATSFKLPKNTLLANKTYQGQLWFQNFTTLDTTSFPGATGATGYYIATNFTIKTGTAVDTTPPDVVAYYVTKAQEFVQAGPGAAVMSDDTPFFFGAFVEERDEDGSTVNEAAVTPPTNVEFVGPQDLFPDDDGGWDFFTEFDTKAELDAAFKTGKYTFSIDTVNQGVKSPAVTLPSESYPVTPHVSNWADAQLIDANSDFTLNWNAFTGGTTGDFIQVSIVNSSDETIFETPGFWESNALVGTARSVVIPNGTLEAGEEYTATLLFANASTLDRATYKNAIGTTAYSKQTSFTLQTIPPEGVLQFQSANFSVNENADPAIAMITVTRIGGSEGEVEIEYSTSDGSADDGSDYTDVTGTLTFANGVTSQTFEIPVLDDEQSEGHETVTLQLMNPTNGAILGTRASATLTILDNELTFGPGNFIDSDGDKYTIKLTGPGTALIALDDLDGDGKGSIKAILLSDTTSTSVLSVTVTKVTGGDGEVSIGRVVSSGNLSSLSAAKSDLIGDGLSVSGLVGQITFDDVLNGADILIGGIAANSTKITLGDVGTGSEVRSGAALSTLATQSFRGNLIEAPAIGTFSTAAGPLLADLNVIGAIKTLTVKGGNANGDWTALNFGTVSITGGGFTGTLRATGTPEQLKTTPSVSSLSITGGPLTGLLSGLAGFNTLSVKKDSAGNGGSVMDSTLSAKSFGTVTIGKNLVRSMILAGANLGLDQVIGGLGPSADTFGAGSIGAVSIGGFVDASILGAGLDPFGEIFHNGNDVVIGGTTSPLKSLTITGTANVSSYFRAGLLPKTAKIAGVTVNTATDARFNDANDVSVSQTDDEGLVTLELNEQPVTLQFVDEVSQRGIPGLLASVTTNTGTPGVAVLMVVDPTDQYSVEFMFLHGAIEPEGEPLQSAANEPEGGASGTDLVVNMLSQVPKTINTFELDDKLPAVPRTGIKTINILESIGAAVKIIDQFTEGALSRNASQNGFPLFKRPQQISLETANRQINDTLRDDVAQKIILGYAGAQLGLAPVVGAAAVGVVIDSGLAIQDTYLVNSNPNMPIFETEFLGVPMYFIDPNAPISNAEMAPTIPPNETRPDSIALFSRTNLNVAFEARIGDENPTIPVPPGDYELVQRKPGRPPVSSFITVPPGGGNLPLGMPELEVASLELIATPQPTGFLDPGTQIKFTVIAKDANGNVIPDNQLDLDCLTPQVFNPAGSSVATLDAPQFEIDSLTGKATAVLTIDESNGAARVSAATCHGVSSNSILVSGVGLALFNLPIVSIGDIEIVEGPKGTNKVAKFPLTLNKAGTQNIVVPFNSQIAGASGVPASATAGVDFQQKVGSITFKPGELAKTIDITIIGDNITEKNEQFLVGLLATLNQNYRLALKNTARGTIIDDDEGTLTINDVSKTEGNSGTTSYVFTVKLSTPNSEVVTVDFATENGTATSASDYTSTSGTLTFQPGETSKSITVSVGGDLDIENNETFAVRLSNAERATISDNLGLGTIVNNDQLRAGQVIIRIVGNGFVTDSTGQIDTRVGRNSAIYGSNDFPFLSASSPFVEWSDPSFFTQFPPLTPSDFANGLILTATFS